jgi:NADH-quinone oxidoreductase subunit N
MTDKLWFLLPEMALFAAMCVVALLGLSPSRTLRSAVPFVAAAALLAALALTPYVYADTERLARAGLLMPMVGKYVKMIVCAVGAALALLSAGLIDRPLELAMAQGRAAFDPLRVARGEYYSFFLLSLIGVMLVCNANDLIWLFLALELTSLPTYIMVAMSRGSRKANEAAMKYFFLGAMAAAMFLYGFALLYASTGTIVLAEMQQAFARQVAETGAVNQMGLIGMILAVLGIAYKIAAAPMHFYTADVYEGAASPVTAFLAFVPKTAGMLALVLVLATVGWTGHRADGGAGLPIELMTVLWMLAVLTMTLGNIGALLQRSVKRMLAYSSIAHSGYMLIGVIAGPALLTGGVAGGGIDHARIDGIAAVMFYMLCYGVMNTAAFAVLAALERKGEEIETLDDLSGLRQRHPLMAAAMALAALSLVGMPPLLGFVGKLYLFIAGVQAGQVVLVVIAGLNSAISAFYYLRLVSDPIMGRPTPQSETVVRNPVAWPRLVAVATALAVVVLPVLAGRLLDASRDVSSPDVVKAVEATAGVTESETKHAESAASPRVSQAEPQRSR